MWVSFSPSGGDACPYPLLPQQVGVLSVLIPHAWDIRPAVMWVSFSPSGGVASPYPLRSQQVGVLSVLIPHV